MDSITPIILTGVIIGVILLAVEYWTGLFNKERRTTDARSLLRQLRRDILIGYERVTELVPLTWKRFISTVKEFLLDLVELGVGIYLFVAPVVILLIIQFYDEDRPSLIKDEQIRQLMLGSYFPIICSVAVLWGLVIIFARYSSTTRKLQDQINYLRRVPGIEKLTKDYDSQLYEEVKAKWGDFIIAVREKHDHPGMAADLENCIPLRVENEDQLVVGCPYRNIRKQINEGSGNHSNGDRFLEQYFNKPDHMICEKVAQEQIRARNLA